MKIIMEFFDRTKQGEVFTKSFTKYTKKYGTVIKRDAVVMGNSKTIDHKKELHTNNKASKIIPLKENGHIVGFQFECSCGEVSRVLLDYEDSSELNAH